MTLDPEPILFAQALIQQEGITGALAGVSVRVGRLEDIDAPPVVLLENAGELHDQHLPMFMPARISVVTYGRTEDEAILLYRAVATIFHRRGRTVIDAIVLGGSFDETGPQPREDTNTNWSARFGVMALYMPDVAIVGA